MKFISRLIGYSALLFSFSSYSNESFDLTNQVCTQSNAKKLENVCQIPEIRKSIDNIKDDYSVVISIDQNTLYLFLNGIKVDEFKVSTGKKSTPTKDGVYFIKSKTKNPDWYFGKIKSIHPKQYYKLLEKYPNGLVPANSLDNMVIGYWIELRKLNNPDEILHFGIHGSPNKRMGEYLSSGCIRTNDLEKLVKVPNGTDVRIE